MSLMKFDPLFPTKSMNRVLDNFFNVGDLIGSDFAMNIPSVNVMETESGFKLELAAPGVAKEDLNIEIEKDRLIVSSSKEQESEESVEGRYTRKEFNYSAFSRSFYLPKTIDKDAISADYDMGVLIINLPKREEIMREEMGRKIEIG